VALAGLQNRQTCLLLALGALLFALDRWTKALVSDSFPLYSSHPVIPGFFDLVHARNTGIAFSMLNDAAPLVREWLLPAFSAMAVVAIFVIFWRQGHEGARIRWALALILTGAAGNLYDRLAYGYVVDFLDFYAGSWHWPAFNVADSCITIGAGLLLLDSLAKPAAAQARQPETA
jgi:signal peptidase II